jgi:transcription elongation factor Elf1
MDKKLEACPWCGSTTVSKHMSWQGHFIKCGSCGFSMAIGNSADELFSAWNTLRAMKDNIDHLNKRHDKDHKTAMSLGSKNAVLAAKLKEAEELLRGATLTVEAIERLVPNWKAYRDLPEAVEMALSQNL